MAASFDDDGACSCVLYVLLLCKLFAFGNGTGRCMFDDVTFSLGRTHSSLDHDDDTCCRAPKICLQDTTSINYWVLNFGGNMEIPNLVEICEISRILSDFDLSKIAYCKWILIQCMCVKLISNPASSFRVQIF